MITLKIVAWGLIAAGGIICVQEAVAWLSRRVALTHLGSERAREILREAHGEPVPPPPTREQNREFLRRVMGEGEGK